MENRIWILLAKELAGESSMTESEELKQLLDQDPILSAMAKEMRENWQRTDDQEMKNALHSFSKIDEKIKGAEVAESKIDIPEHKSILIFKRYKIVLSAAAIFLLFLAGWYLFKNENNSSVNKPLPTHEIAAAVDSIRKINLPDGSEVRLNAASKVVFDESFNKAIREVWLTGEAFFDVVKNKDKPFIIHTGKVNVKVLGTAFNVRAYPDEQNVETSLVRGKVEITVNDEPGKKYLLSPNQKLTIPLSQNDSLSTTINVSANKQKKYGVLQPVRDFYSKDSVIAELSWMDGKIAFYETSFKELSYRLGKKYNVSFVFNDPEKEKLEFTGVFYNQTLQQVLQRLAIADPFSYKIENNVVYILK
ncbi:MAG: FecR family protein [Chitinophagaceae bacterium]